MEKWYLGKYPGFAEFPAPTGSQEVVTTPTNAHCWLVNIYLDTGRVLQTVQDGSHLINVMICIDIDRAGWVTRACILGGCSLPEDVAPLVPSQAPLLHQVTRSFNTKTTGTRLTHWPLKMRDLSCTQLLSEGKIPNLWHHIDPGTQRVREFLLTQGERPFIRFIN